MHKCLSPCYRTIYVSPHLARLLIASLLVLIGAGCEEAADPRLIRAGDVDSASALQAQLQQWAALASADTGRCSTLNGTCTVAFTATPANYHCAVDCANGPAQTQPITVTFAEPIYQLIVMSSGAFSCSGTYGTVTVYNRAYRGYGGQQVEQRSFVINDPSDCGPDDITCCGVDTLTFPGGIDHIVIEPPQPWTWPVYINGNYVGDGNASAYYYYSFYEQRRATAPCLTGDELLDQQAMRDFLKAAWDSSHASGVPGNRRETPGIMFEDSLGNLGYRLYQDLMKDTPCASAGTPVGALPGIPIAEGHTHPFAPKDTVPPSCFKQPLKPGQFRQYDVKKYGGASDSDLVRIRDDSLPFYILDKDAIYGYPPETTRKNAKSVVKRYPRVDPQTGCLRV